MGIGRLDIMPDSLGTIIIGVVVFSHILSVNNLFDQCITTKRKISCKNDYDGDEL